MNDNRNKIIIGVTAAIIAILLTIGWSLWRQHVNKTTPVAEEPQNTATIQTTPSQTLNDTTTPTENPNTTPTPTPTSLTQQQIDQYTQTVNKFEHASRDWGTDPNAATNPNLALQPTNTINQFRTPATLDPKPLDDISGIQRDPNTTGPTAPSPWCTPTDPNPMCDEQKTMLDYWRNNDWIMGARHTSEPKITYNPADNTFTAEGTIKAILWSQDTGAGYRGSTDQDTYWAYTPVTGEFPYTDTITIDTNTGKISQRKTTKAVTLWLADPWYSKWDLNPAEQTMSWQNRQQANIPLHGYQPMLVTSNQMKPNADISYLRNGTDTDSGLWAQVPTEALPDTSVPELN